MKAKSIHNNPVLVRRLAYQAIGKGVPLSDLQQTELGSGKSSLLERLIHERDQVQEATNYISGIRNHDSGDLLVVLVDETGLSLKIKDNQAISDVIHCIKHYLKAKDISLTKKINTFNK